MTNDKWKSMFNFYFFLNIKNKKKKICVKFYFFQKNEKWKSVVNFHFFFSGLITEMKLTRKERYNRFPCNCCHQLRSCSVDRVFLLQCRKITLFFFSGEGERGVERLVKKIMPVIGERLAQMFGVSHTADYCYWADVSFQVFFRGMHVTAMEELQRQMMREL